MESIDKNRIGVLKSLGEGDPSFFRELVERFLSDAKQEIEAIEEALVSSDHLIVSQLAHKLKGSSYNMGAARLGRICEAISEGVEHKDVRRTTEGVKALGDELSKVEKLLQADL